MVGRLCDLGFAMIFYFLKNLRFITFKTRSWIRKDEVLLRTDLYDEEKKYSTAQPHLSPLGLSTFLRWNVRPSDIERRSSLVVLSFSADEPLTESGARCVLFIPRANARVLRFRPEIWSLTRTSLIVLLVAWLFQSVTRDDSIIKSIRIFSWTFAIFKNAKIRAQNKLHNTSNWCLIPSGLFYLKAIFAFYSSHLHDISCHFLL